MEFTGNLEKDFWNLMIDIPAAIRACELSQENMVHIASKPVNTLRRQPLHHSSDRCFINHGILQT
jgi:hypothetical protein